MQLGKIIDYKIVSISKVKNFLQELRQPYWTPFQNWFELWSLYSSIDWERKEILEPINMQIIVKYEDFISQDLLWQWS